MQTHSSKPRTMSIRTSNQPLPQIKTPHTLRTQRSVLLKQKEEFSKDRALTSIGASRSQHIRHSQSLVFMEKKLEKEVKNILELFKQINKLREDYGVISLREDGQDEDFYLEPREVTYNADLPQLNEQICNLKSTIQAKIDKVISMAKYFPPIQTLMQQLLTEQFQANIAENVRVGKIGAMKAQRRLIECSQQEKQKIRW